MADYFSIEGANAQNGSFADYSNSFFSLAVDGSYDAYYVIRSAYAAYQSSASLTNNSIFVTGSAGADTVSINAQVTANDLSSAYSYGNYWSADLGEGDDASIIHTLVSAVGPGTVASASYDSASITGGGGADLLISTHNLSALDGAYASIGSTARFVHGGSGFDTINAQTTISSGQAGLAGGSADYSYNNLYVNPGEDGANVLATSLLSSVNGGTVNVTGNGKSFNGGSFINASSSIEAGTADLAGGAVNYSGNSVSAMTSAEGGTVFAQNSLFAFNGGSINFTDDLAILVGNEGADFLSAGTSIQAGSAQNGVAGGTVAALNSSAFVGGEAGNDTIDFFLSGWAEMGGNVTISGNYFYGLGGDGDDTLNLNWWTLANDGAVDFSGNNADLDGGAGSDTINAYLGEGVTGSSINIFGGEGDDFIETTDLGENNERLIVGGSGNDTIIDDAGFSTVVLDGNFADYTLTALNGGWISITDNRDGTPDGTDQLYQVDQLQFGDGNVLIADLHLPIEGTQGNDTLFGGEGDDIIYGYGGNDSLNGGLGNDLLDGGAGNDVLTGLNGDDALIGGAGNDQLIGNRGADHLTGGSGADKFIYGALFQSAPDAPDVITDFSGKTVLSTNGQGNPIRTPGEGDKIDLSLIDANTNLDGDQAFTLVQQGFSGTAGEAYSSFNASTGVTSLFLDVNGDAVADMTIQLLGQANLTGADFIF